VTDTASAGVATARAATTLAAATAFTKPARWWGKRKGDLLRRYISGDIISGTYPETSPEPV
jgi:hypothetical protein